jgi:hypothetical protein
MPDLRGKTDAIMSAKTEIEQSITDKIMAQKQLDADAEVARGLIDETRALQMKIQEFQRRVQMSPQDVVLTWAMKKLSSPIIQ